MRLFTLLLAFFLLSISLEAAQTVYGKVQSKDEKAPLPGASVRVVDSQKGTYANSRGVFKLQIDAKDKELLIKSIGYKSKKVSVNSLTDTLLILLEADRVVSGTALVYGEIEPYTLIERAIARKKSNSAKIKTVEGKLQTKVYADAGESLLPGGGDNSISVTMEIGGEEKKEAPKKILMESIAINYKDYDKDIYHSHIISRRQTKNVPAQVNMFVMGEFINFYDERIELMETKIISPMADDAQDYYSYKIIERQILDGKYIYIVEVIPNSTLYPTFDGKIMISEGDYDFVGAELTTSPHTAISFVKSLKFTEKFEKYDHNLWYPNFLEIKSALGADIIKGSFSIDLELTLTSIYSDLKLNEKLPDSLYTEQVKWVTVSSLADSTDKDYWQNNSLFADSKEDEKIYAEVDSLVVNVDSLQQEEDFSFGFTPYLDFNRASDVMYGLTPNIGYKDWYLSYKGAYSTGTDQYYSSLYLNGLFDVSSVQFSANVGYHQEIAVFSDDNTSPRELNTLQAGLFGKDYYDYYQADVFRASIGMQYKELNLGLSFEQSDQQAIGVNTSKYAFGDINWRANPTIDNQKYQTLKYNLLFGSKGFLGIGETPFYLSLYGLFGKQISNDIGFSTVHAEGKISMPLYETGYAPLELVVYAQAAIASEDTPAQYQFRLQNNLVFQNSALGFYSAPLAEIGGNELYSSTVRFKLSDYLWRAVGLPVYKGRGLELELVGSAAYSYDNSKSYYKGTGVRGYLEAGFHIGRIPSYFSDFIFFGFDYRKQIDGDNCGWGISFSAPF